MNVLIFILLILLILILSYLIISANLIHSNAKIKTGGNSYLQLYYSINNKLKNHNNKLEMALNYYKFQYKSTTGNLHILFGQKHINDQKISIIRNNIKVKKNECIVFESGIIRYYGNKKGISSLDKLNMVALDNVYYACDDYMTILNDVVFPSLGLKRRPLPIIEIEAEGALLPFSHLIIKKKVILIPYMDATSKEITIAQNIYFNNEFFTLKKLMERCELYNVFLICCVNKIIGFLAFTREKFINVAIIEEYQNYGIASAMIAQFMEIYYFRIYPLPNYDELKMIYITASYKLSINIANKLFFTFNGKEFERPCKIQNIIWNGNKTLTYHLFSIDDGSNKNYLIKKLEPYMKRANSSFSHLAVSSFDKKNYKLLKSTTGSYLKKDFIVHMCELKSTMRANINTIESLINKEHFNKDKNIEIIVFFVLYLSKNGIKKIYAMDSYRTKTHINIDETKLKTFIKIISKLIIVGNYFIYNESNAGFKTFSIAMAPSNDDPTDPKIYTINNHIQVVLEKVNEPDYINYVTSFSTEYYDWLCSRIIFPHFGLSKQIKPIAIDIVQNTSHVFFTSPEIIANLALDLHKWYSNSLNKINIFYNDEDIGYITLIKNGDIITLKHIELISHRKKNISSHVLFILMDILAAYYAPSNISLQFLVVDTMINIANNLRFEKKKEYFIRKCRPIDNHFLMHIDIDNTTGAHAFTDIDWVENTKNFDCGSGAYYKFINEYLLYRFHIKNIPYDPYALPKYINEHALQLVKNGDFDTATSMSVLNVIEDKESRIAHIKLMKSALKKNGIAYFKIWQGNKSGIKDLSNKFHQNNLKLEYYLPEIDDIFQKTEIIQEKNLIIAYN